MNGSCMTPNIIPRFGNIHEGHDTKVQEIRECTQIQKDEEIFDRSQFGD